MNWVNLNTNNTFTEAQLKKRKQSLLDNKYTQEEQVRLFAGLGSTMELESFNLVQTGLDNDHEIAYTQNELLKDVLQYEQATNRLSQYILAEGVATVEEIPEGINEETGEVTQEYVPAVVGIDPLPATITVHTYDEDGEVTGTEDIANPEIVQDTLERAIAQDIIDKAKPETIALFNARKN